MEVEEVVAEVLSLLIHPRKEEGVVAAVAAAAAVAVDYPLPRPLARSRQWALRVRSLISTGSPWSL